MRKGIATVSLSGLLADKLEAVAGAGFDGIELFDNDLVASPLSPRQVASRCAELGLCIDLFQPLRDVEGVPPQEFDDVVHRVRTKLDVMADLGTATLLACSSVRPDTRDDPDLSAEQLHRLGDLAAERGMTIAFEALAWGRHVNRLAQAWNVVQRCAHPAVTVAVDTFHMLARGDGAAALSGIPGERIGFLQVADAPVLDMNLLEWSRHHRCFPGQGSLDVTEVVATVLAAGYRGPLSLEVFSDVVREADPRVTALDAMRSLLFLEDQLAGAVDDVGHAWPVSAAPRPPSRTDTAFLELAISPDDAGSAALLEALGFVHVGEHRSKPVSWWRNGDAHVLLNRGDGSVHHDDDSDDDDSVHRGDRSEPAHATALGVTATPVQAVAARADALLWPAVDTLREQDEAPLPGITTPSGLHVFVSGERGSRHDWQCDFTSQGAGAGAGPAAPTAGGHLRAIDHVGVAVAPDALNQQVAFFRTLFDLAPGPVEEFMDPHGRLLSRALRPRNGDLRVVLNVADTGPDHPLPLGVNQVAFACSDVVAAVRDLRAQGISLMPVPDNYYVDLDARFRLGPDLLDELRTHQLLYDRVRGGELLHAYTYVLPTGFYVEVLERRGGYDGYGSASTHVRLAAQTAPSAEAVSRAQRAMPRSRT